MNLRFPVPVGYQVCDRLRQIPDFKTTPIVFLSSHSSLRERLQGYECGGTDYLTKPFEPDTLLAKIKVIDETVNERLKLELQAREAEKFRCCTLETMDAQSLALCKIKRFLRQRSFNCLLSRLLRFSRASLEYKCS